MHTEAITNGDGQRTQVGPDPLDYVLRYAACDYDCYYQGRYVGSRAARRSARRSTMRQTTSRLLPSPSRPLDQGLQSANTNKEFFVQPRGDA